MEEKIQNIVDALSKRFVSHPWHGISIGENSPEKLNAFIEIIPSDTIKYEVDKVSGYNMVDRPQKYSNNMPCWYGFVPQTYCDTLVAEYANEKTGRTNIVGDEDPLDICIISERQVDRGNILAEAIPVGGFRMIDGGEADDKIIAVLKDDQAYGDCKDISELPTKVMNRVKHFFLTYKDFEGGAKEVEITHVYGKEEAYEVIKRSNQDYINKYGNVNENLVTALLDALK